MMGEQPRVHENPFGLQGKRILVTGASSGIGRQVAIDCALLGAQVILSARNEERTKEVLSQLPPNDHSYLLGDLTDADTIERIVAEVEGLDGVVLCAGVGKTQPFKFCKPEIAREVYEINLFSQIELLRCLVRGKKITRNASVVFISSIGGTRVITPGNLIYGSSKAAMESAVKFCALELAPQVRVNSVLPGMVNTSLIQNRTSWSSEQTANDLKNYPLGRYGEPQDISNGVIFLLSDASKWMTGQSLVIDGGRTLK